MSFGYKALPQSSSYDFISNANLNVNEAGSRAGEGNTNRISSAANDSRLRRAQSRGVEQGQLHQVLRRFRKRQQNLHHDSKEYFCRREKEVHEPLRAQSNPTLTWHSRTGHSDYVLARIKVATFFYAMVYPQLGLLSYMHDCPDGQFSPSKKHNFPLFVNTSHSSAEW